MSNKRKMLLLPLLVIVSVVAGLLLVHNLPTMQKQKMISRLQSHDATIAYQALVWLAQHKGAAAFDIAYTQGSPYIHQLIPDTAKQMYLGQIPGTPPDMALPRITADETFAILQRGLQDKDLTVRSDSALSMSMMQSTKPIVNAQNIGQLIPYMDDKNRFDNSPLWAILENTSDRAMLEIIPDSVFLKSIAGNYPMQASNALMKKYATREVNWKYGASGLINLPNSILLTMMHSPEANVRIIACYQLAYNYYSVATKNLASQPSSDPLHGGTEYASIDYAGPALRNDARVEETMGISTNEVIDVLNGTLWKDLDGNFSPRANSGPQLWRLLTGKDGRSAKYDGPDGQQSRKSAVTHRG